MVTVTGKLLICSRLHSNTVNAYVRIFEAHNFDYSDLNELDDAALLALFPYNIF